MENNTLQPDADQFARIGSLCLCANLRRASRAITALYDQFLQPSGLLATQFILLASLGAQSPVALTPLADTLGMDPTTLARNLKPLERNGWVQILPGADRRTRMVQLTAHGRAALATALPLWEQAQAAATRQLGQDRARVMLADWSEVAALAGR